MKSIIIVFLTAAFALTAPGCKHRGTGHQDPYIIQKENGHIILAYKAFRDFLASDRSWESYQALVLDAYPQVRVVHDRQLGWGVIDSITFPEEIRQFKTEDFEALFTQYNTETFHYLYDSIAGMAQSILKPLHEKQVDLCFFLPYGSCFAVPGQDRNTIFISMWINPGEVEKIMAHEYSHILHDDRRPEEALTLGKELVSEGLAVYLTTRIISDLEISDAVPFMPAESFEWCMSHEQLIRDSIWLDINDSTERLFTRYISDGSFAEPPDGFVQKTGYFTGYRIIEQCIDQGMSLEEICSLDSRTVILKSNYFPVH